MEKRPWLLHYDLEVPHRLKYPRFSLNNILDDAARISPEKTCIYFKENKYSFGEIKNLVEKIARFLVEIGIRKGDRVGIILPNSPDFVLAFFGILRAGGVVVAINPRYKESEISFVIEDSNIKGLFIQPQQSNINAFFQNYNHAIFRVSCPVSPFKYQKILCHSNAILPQKHYTLQEVLAYGSLEIELPDIDQEDAAIFQYSGGTTGIPKAAIGLHRNVISNIYQFSNWLNALAGDKEVFLSVIPLYHVYGMLLTMCLAIKMQAAQVLLQDPQDVKGIIEAISQHHATIFPSVPNMFSAILNINGIANKHERLKSLKICISGSAPLDMGLKVNFESLTNSKILEGYGLSETPTATHCNPVKGTYKAGSIGMPLPDVDCRIIDIETGTRELQQGENGELVIRGPQVMKGYHNREEETLKTLKGGWLYTGDFATMDEDGYFFITGRIKELIKVSGFQVWPREIEEIILKYPGINDAAVAGIKSPETGERPKAWIILNENSTVDLKELKDFCKKYLADYKVPQEFEIVLDFPRTTVGKILRRELVRLDEKKTIPDKNRDCH
jgi:long-chain acyl-CoA synthetase